MATNPFDLLEFQSRLGEAMAWYLSKAPVLDPEHGLRTAALAPPAGLKTPTERTWGEPSQQWTSETLQNYLDRVHRDRPKVLKERQALVDEIAKKRRTLLKESRTEPSQITEAPFIGRLLVYEPDQNLSDGAASLASEGFFDAENAPPWDIWLVCVTEAIRRKKRSYLLAWVPPEFLELATAGIEANPEECIRWVEDVDAEFVCRLRDVGLLRRE